MTIWDSIFLWFCFIGTIVSLGLVFVSYLQELSLDEHIKKVGKEFAEEYQRLKKNRKLN